MTWEVDFPANHYSHKSKHLFLILLIWNISGRFKALHFLNFIKKSLNKQLEHFCW